MSTPEEFDVAAQSQLTHLSAPIIDVYSKVAADGAAATATAETATYVATGNETITGLFYVPSAALTADNTNNATLLVQKRDGLGGAPSTVASLTTNVAAGNWLAFQKVSLGAITGGALAAGTVLTLTISKGGSGVAVPAGALYATMTVA